MRTTSRVRTSSWAAPVLVGLAYAAGSTVALSWFNARGLGPTFFPSAGITLASLVLLDRRTWLPVLSAVAVAEFLLDVTHGLPPRASIGYAVANTVEPLTGAVLVTRFFGRVDLSRRRDLAGFLACCVLGGPAAGALIAATNAQLFAPGTDSWSEFVLRWWIGDGLGVLVVGGALIGGRQQDRAGPARLASVSGILLAGGALASVAAVLWREAFPLVFVPVVLLVWIAFRFGTRGVTIIGAGMGFVTAQAVASGRDVWTQLGVSPTTGWVYLQVLLALVITVALILAVEIRERERSLVERDQSLALLGLQKAVAAMAAAATQDDVLRAVLGEGLAAAGSSGGAVLLSSPDGDLESLGSTALSGPGQPDGTSGQPDGTSGQPDGALISPAGAAGQLDGERLLLVEALQTGVPVLVGDRTQLVAGHPAVEALLDGSGAAWAAVPFPQSASAAGGVVLRFDAPQRFGPDQVAVLSMFTEAAGQALARATAHAREQRARQRAELLARVSAELNRAANTVQQRLQRLAELLVPDLADYVTLELPGVDGPELVAAVHADPRQLRFVVAARRQRRVGADQPRGVPRVLATGQSELVETLTSADVEEDPTRAETLALIGALDPRSYLIVPLNARGQVIAALLMAQSVSGRRFTRDDLVLAQEIADLAALAVDNARLYQREHQVALDLQTAMLPKATVTVPGVRIAVRYRAAEQQLQVGGDWYDVLPLPAGRIGLVIGDVLGHSLDAAVVMGQLRSAANALGPTVCGPAELLTRLEAFAGRVPAADLATLCYLELDPRSGTVRYASAGHPPPVLLDAEGSPHLLDGAQSMPLCVEPSAARPEATTQLRPGSLLVLYTDGLVERRGESLTVGTNRLLTAIAAHRSEDPERLSDALIDELLGVRPFADDVALLCLSYTGRESPDSSEGRPPDDR
jgi:serine/threonine-protein kinase RsbW